jgi:flagellar basal body-associated protein FliL
MAEKAEKKPDAAAAAPAAGGGAAAAAAAAKDGHGKAGGGGGIGALLGKTPVMLGGVMILEAAVLFAGFKFLGGGPRPVGASVITEDPAASGGHGGEVAKDEHGNPIPGGSHAAKGKTAEVQVLDFKAQNKQTGRLILYDLSVFVVVKTESEQQVKDTIAARKALITDRIRTIIAQNDPEKLGGGSEPGLETLRRQVKHQLDEIVGDGLIEEVLIPRCIPFRTDF